MYHQRRIPPYAPRGLAVSLLRSAADALALLAFLLLALRVTLRVLANWHAERAAARRTWYCRTIGRLPTNGLRRAA